MKLRLYKNAQSAQNQADSEALRRRRQSMANASSAESADSMDASTDVGGSDLGRQDILHMQQTHGNAFVRRYLAKNQLTSSAEQPPTSIQRDSKPGNSVGSSITLMTVTSDSGRKFKGTNKVPGQEGKIELLSFSLGRPAHRQAPNAVPRGPGLPAPEPEPTQLHFTKSEDGSTADWFMAANAGDRITSVKIESGQLDEKGHFKVERTIELKHGVVVGMNMRAVLPVRADQGALENVEIEFTGTAEFNRAAPAGAKAP